MFTSLIMGLFNVVVRQVPHGIGVEKRDMGIVLSHNVHMRRRKAHGRGD